MSLTDNQGGAQRSTAHRRTWLSRQQALQLAVECISLTRLALNLVATAAQLSLCTNNDGILHAACGKHIQFISIMDGTA